jgi:lysophospholipase L1-like esterase
VLGTLTTASPTAAQASGSPSGATYVALGDSYASGEGLSPYEPGTDVVAGAERNQCHRSAAQAYADLSPPLVLPGVTDRAFWACSGATVGDMEQVPPQSGPDEQFNQVDQVSSVGDSTEWITLSIGGNDVGFSSITDSCIEAIVDGSSVDHLSSVTCAQQLAASTAQLGTLQGSLESLYSQLLTRAPAARLVVVGYPRIFPPSYLGAPTVAGQQFCLVGQLTIPSPQAVETVDVGLPTADAQAVDAFMVLLDDTMEDAIAVVAANPADAGRIRYADTYRPSTPLNCLGTTPGATVAGFELAPAGTGVGPGGIVGSGSFHPTAAGQQLLAQVVQQTIEQFPPVVITPPGLPVGTVGRPYTGALGASGGIAPYDWSVVGGHLPSGLSLDAATGVISGTPVVAGETSLDLMASDIWGDQGDRSYVIDIANPMAAAVTQTVTQNRRHQHRATW